MSFELVLDLIDKKLPRMLGATLYLSVESRVGGSSLDIVLNSNRFTFLI